jgi:hypothetical protein
MAEPTEVNHLTASQRDAVVEVHGAENVDVIPEDGDRFTVQIRFDDPPAASADPGWSTAQAMDQQDFHSKFGGQEWKYDANGVFLRGSATPEKSDGSPVTCSTIVSLYGREILKASHAHGIPPELIVMTIATESGANRSTDFSGPPTFRWEALVKVNDVTPRTVGDYSAGPMQTLATTARAVFRRIHPGQDPFAAAPAFATRPNPRPETNPLYDAGLSIDLGTAVLKENLPRTGFDPILVAACYNHGSIGRGDGNPWHLFTAGDHLNRASQWYGDACAVIGKLRKGGPLDSSSVQSPKLKVISTDPSGAASFEISKLTRETADSEAEFYRNSDATVQLVDDGDGLFTLQVQFSGAGPGLIEDGPDDATLPDRDGYVIVINRIRTEKRASTGAPGKIRTIGSYQAYFNRQKIAGLGGTTVEQHGPGDNSLNGRAHTSRIEAGSYPLFTHAGGVGSGGRVKYNTFEFSRIASVTARPWPALRVEHTSNRSGILIHCASGFMMTVGCINLGSNLQNASSNINFSDSRNRVIALITSMQQNLPDFPTEINRPILNAFLQIVGEP